MGEYFGVFAEYQGPNDVFFSRTSPSISHAWRKLNTGMVPKGVKSYAKRRNLDARWYEVLQGDNHKEDESSLGDRERGQRVTIPVESTLDRCGESDRGVHLGTMKECAYVVRLGLRECSAH